MVPKAAATGANYMYKRFTNSTKSSKKRFRPNPTSAVVPGVTRNYGLFNRFNSRGVARQELKFYNYQQILTLAGATNITQYNTLVSYITQGAGANQRIGRRIWVKSLTLRIVFHWGTQQITGINWGPQCLRFIVYGDTQCNGAAANAADFFDGTVITFPEFWKFNNLYNKGRFKTLRDKYVSGPTITYYPNAANYYVSPHRRFFQCHIKFRRPMPITFTGTTGGIADLACNNIGVFFAKDGTLATEPTCDAEFVYRVRYYG